MSYNRIGHFSAVEVGASGSKSNPTNKRRLNPVVVAAAHASTIITGCTIQTTLVPENEGACEALVGQDAPSQRRDFNYVNDVVARHGIHSGIAQRTNRLFSKAFKSPVILSPVPSGNRVNSIRSSFENLAAPPARESRPLTRGRALNRTQSAPLSASLPNLSSPQSGVAAMRSQLQKLATKHAEPELNSLKSRSRSLISLERLRDKGLVSGNTLPPLNIRTRSCPDVNEAIESYPGTVNRPYYVSTAEIIPTMSVQLRQGRVAVRPRPNSYPGSIGDGAFAADTISVPAAPSATRDSVLAALKRPEPLKIMSVLSVIGNTQRNTLSMNGSSQ